MEKNNSQTDVQIDCKKKIRVSMYPIKTYVVRNFSIYILTYIFCIEFLKIILGNRMNKFSNLIQIIRTLFKADLRQDINGGFAFSRCLNGTFP